MNIKELKGQNLFYYLTHDSEDKDYASTVALLPIAVNGVDEAFALLERIVAQDKKLIAIYPSIEDIDTSEMKYVGEIPDDGALYIK